MRTLPPEFAAYSWAPSTRELARALGLDPSEIVRFDGNVPALAAPLLPPRRARRGARRRPELPARRLPGADRGASRATPASSPRTSSSAPAPTT